jgi:hypothetical protein
MTDIRERLDRIQKAIFEANQECSLASYTLEIGGRSPGSMAEVIGVHFPKIQTLVAEARLLIVGDE